MLFCSGITNTLQRLGYFPRENLSKFYERFLSKKPMQWIDNFVTFSTVSFLFISPSVYILAESDSDVDKYEITYKCAAGANILGTYTLFVFQKPAIVDLANQFEALIATRFEPASKELYQENRRNIDQFSKKIRNVLLRGIAPSYWIIPFMIKMIQYARSGFAEQFTDTSTLPGWLPFDLTTPAGYIAGELLQGWVLIYAADTILCVSFVFYSFCRISMAFATDLDQSIARFNADIVKAIKPISQTNRLFHEKFCNIIQFHGDSKQLVHKFCNLFKRIVFLQLMFAIIGITSALLQCQMSYMMSSWIVVWRSTGTAMGVMVWLYLLCNSGEKLTNSFLRVADTIYQSPWYLYPIRIRKYIPLMIAVAQKPIYVQGLGNFRFTRATFKTVVKSAFLYFVVIRQSMELQLRVYQLYRNFKSRPVHF